MHAVLFQRHDYVAVVLRDARQQANVVGILAPFPEIHLLEFLNLLREPQLKCFLALV